jgi:hypothetical protein
MHEDWESNQPTTEREMFNIFTDVAREKLTNARYIAGTKELSKIDAECLFISITRKQHIPDFYDDDIIKELSIPIIEFEMRVPNSSIGDIQYESYIDELKYSNCLKEAILYALKFVNNHNISYRYIGSSELLYGLICTKDFGIKLEKIAKLLNEKWNNHLEDYTKKEREEELQRIKYQEDREWL